MSDQALAPFLRSARDYVQRAIGVELDGSETSLAFLDHYVEKVREKGEMKPEVLKLVAASLGAYFGEVLRAKLGGRWILDGDPSDWRLELEVGPLTVHPIGVAAAALLGDDAEGYDASFHTRPEWMGPLQEALAAAPPVDEAYYYSFTGRLETIEHAGELLAEILRRERERKN
jgi:hypothetical protein